MHVRIRNELKSLSYCLLMKIITRMDGLGTEFSRICGLTIVFNDLLLLAKACLSSRGPILSSSRVRRLARDVGCGVEGLYMVSI